jgi:hypothetical protein
VDGTTDVEGEGATTMLGATVKTVALSVPVGLMLCGAVLLGATMARVSVPVAAEAELETDDPEAIAMAEAEPDAVTPDSVVVPNGVTRPVADTVAVAVTDSLPKFVPEGAERVAEPLSEPKAEVGTAVSDAVTEVAESMAGAEPDVAPEVGTPVSRAEPKLEGPAADAVSGVTEADGDSVALGSGETGIISKLDVTGMTDINSEVDAAGMMGITSELDGTGIIEDKFDVSGSGMFVVGIGEDTPSVAATEDSSEETPGSVGITAVGKSEGSTEDTAVTDGIALCPVPRTEETRPLERTLGSIITGIVASVEDPVLVETGGTALLVEVPSIVSRPTVIPDEVINGVAASVKLDRELIAEVMGGMTTEGRIPVDDSAMGLVATLGLVTAPLETEVSPMGTTGTTPVLEAAVVSTESEPPVEPVAAVTSGKVEAVPTKVGPALVDATILVEGTSEPRPFVAVATSDDNAEGEGVSLDRGPVITGGGALLSDVPRVGRDEAITTSDDSLTAVRLVAGDGIDVTAAGIEDSVTGDPAEVSIVTRVGTTTADVSPGSVVVIDVATTTEDSGAEGEIVSGLATINEDETEGATITEVGTTTADVSPGSVTVVDVATTTDDSAEGKTVTSVDTRIEEVWPWEVTSADVGPATSDDSESDVTMGEPVAEGGSTAPVRDSAGKVALSTEGTTLVADGSGTFVVVSGEGGEAAVVEAARLDTTGSEAMRLDTAGLETAGPDTDGSEEAIEPETAGLEAAGLDGAGSDAGVGETAEMDGIGSEPGIEEATGMDALGAAALEETGSAIVGLELAAGGLEAAGSEEPGLCEAGSETTGLDATEAGIAESVGADDRAGSGLGTVSGITTGAEVGDDGAVDSRLGWTGADKGVAAEAGRESVFTTGADPGVEDAAGVPVLGDPITEPEESTVTVTGTTTTAVSVPGVILDEDKLGSDTTPGDSCLEVSTLEVN